MFAVHPLDGDRKGLVVTGEVDVATAAPFREALEGAISGGNKEIYLDLSDMDYIDSTGIGILIDLKKNVIGPDQQFILIHPKRSIKKLFQLTGVDQIFAILED